MKARSRLASLAASPSGPQWPQVPPNRAQGRPWAKMEGKSFSNVILYKKRENLKNDDPPTRKPYFLEIEV